MNSRITTFIFFVVTAILSFAHLVDAQGASGALADAHNPSGQPSPQSNNNVWHVEPLSGALTVHIPFSAHTVASRGFTPSFGLTYNSSSSYQLRSGGISYVYNGGSSGAAMLCSDISDSSGNAALGNCYSVYKQDPFFDANSYFLYSREVFYWAGPYTNNTVGVSQGPWAFSGPKVEAPSYEIPDQYYWEDLSGGQTGSIGTKVFLGDGCAVRGEFIYTDENGSSHPLGVREQYDAGSPLISTGNSPSYPCQKATTTASASSIDGSAILTTLDTTEGTAAFEFGPLLLADGTAITASNLMSVLTIEDTNGNISTPSVDSLNRTLFQVTQNGLMIGEPAGTDSTGATISSGLTTVTTLGPTGASEQYQIAISSSTAPNNGFTMPHPTSTELRHLEWTGGVTAPTSFSVENAAGAVLTEVTSVTQPDGTSYSINYDQVYGTISRITFPEGGYVRFVWGINPIGEIGVGDSCASSTLVVTDVFISSGNGTESHWIYGAPTLNGSSNACQTSVVTSSVTSPDGTVTSYTGTAETYSMEPMYAAPSWLETQRLISNSQGVPIRSVSTSYTANLPEKGLPAAITTTLYDGPTPLQQQVAFTYDAYANVIEKDESDFYTCSGAPCPVPTTPPSGWLRKTFTNYLWSNPNPSQPAFNYPQAHIVDKPSQVLVTDGSGNPASLTIYTYDEPSHIGFCPGSNQGCGTGLTTHDDTNYGSNTVARGDLTTQSRCITISGTGTAATCGSSWNTSYYYDYTGQVTEIIDGPNTSKAAISIYTWGGQMAGFLQSVQHPNGAIDSYAYYTPTGQINTHTDWNHQTTTYSYTDPSSGTPDPLNRIRAVTSPATLDGTTGTSAQATVVYTYNDSPGVLAVQKRTTINSGITAYTTTSYDGLGRETSTVSTAPQCSSGIETDTTYNSMGYAYSVSSPYCSGGSAGSLTEFTYDAIGRRLSSMTTYDGATTRWSYSGRATQVIEPSNGSFSAQRISQTDGLGRMTSLCEVSSISPPTGPAPANCGMDSFGSGYLTNYTYDTMGDLCTAQQAQSGPTNGSSASCPAALSSDASSVAHVRRFSYDAISRLLSNMNPETSSVYASGSSTVSSFAPVSYTYSSSISACSADPSSPCTKTDARGFTTSYQYDNMARLTGKSYTSPSGPTDLSACFQYDTAVSGDSNPLGALTMSWLQAGACPSTSQSSISSGEYNIHILSGHDAMGRTTVDQQCLTASSCSSTTGFFNYGYNLIGSTVRSSNGISSGMVGATAADTFNTSPASLPSFTWESLYDQAGQLSSLTVQSEPAVWGPNAAYLADPTLLSASSSSAYDPFGHLINAQLGIAYGGSASAVQMARFYDPLGRITSEVDGGTVVTNVATGSLGTITISGNEQSKVIGAVTGVAGTATIYVSGYSNGYNSKTITIIVNGKKGTTTYAGNSIPSSSIAAMLASAINSTGALVSASNSGSTVTVTATTTGSATNYSLSVSDTDSAISISAPSALSGGVTGSSGTSVYDAGTITATINGTASSYTWNNSSTATSIASGLAAAINSNDSSFLTANNSNGVVTLTSNSTGGATNWPITTSVTDYSTNYLSSSFSATPLNMSGGINQGTNPGTIYSYAVGSSGYALNSKILAHTDSVMGTWNFSYDPLNRLSTAIAGASVPIAYSSNFGCWSYDAFGNRLWEEMSTTPCTGSPAKQSWANYNPVNNQVTSASTSTAGFAYDQTGNVIYDGVNNYWYNTEGQLCAVYQPGGSVTTYLYDAEGQRVAKGTLNSVPIGGAIYTNVATNGSCGPVTASTNGFTLGSRYLLDLGGNQVTELTGTAQTWEHSNVWAGSKLMATYDSTGVHFPLTDPLGTKRIQANAFGIIDLTCISLPFGDGPPCSGIGATPLGTEHRYTGKERDTESGNDYFGARYYASSMGRWLSPDTDFNLKRILAEPQRWNRYAYVLNNPLILVDPNGLWDIYVFRPEAKGNSAAWNRAAADAKANGNTMHILNGSAATRGAYLDALKNGDAKVVFVGHSVDDATGKAGSLLLTGNQAVGKLSPYVNPDGTGGTVPSVATPGSIGAESVGAFACTSDTLSGQYSSTDFSGLSGMVFDRTADAGAAAYTDVLARDGSTSDADSAAQKAMDKTQTTINPSDGKPAGPAPKVKEHPDDN